MTEQKTQQVKTIYGEILGIVEDLPTDTKPCIVNRSVAQLYDGAIDALNVASGNDYSRFKTARIDVLSGAHYDVNSLRPKMGSLLSRLEQEYGFRRPKYEASTRPTNIVTIQNNQQLSVTIVPIQTIIDNIEDSDLRADVEELKEVIQDSKDRSRASKILNAIQQKSWDVFIALLPVVLEQLGRPQS